MNAPDLSLTKERLKSLRDIFQHWLDWNQEQRAREGLEVNDHCHVIAVPPHWPTRGNLRAWIETLDGARSDEPGAIPGEVVKCYACGQVRGYILDVQKSIGLAEEIEDARRTTVEMPHDLKRSLGVALVAQGAEYCGNWPCRLLKYHTGPCSSSERT